MLIITSESSAPEWESVLNTSSLRCAFHPEGGADDPAADFDGSLRNALLGGAHYRDLSCFVIPEAALETHKTIWEEACGDG